MDMTMSNALDPTTQSNCFDLYRVAVRHRHHDLLDARCGVGNVGDGGGDGGGDGDGDARYLCFVLVMDERLLDHTMRPMLSSDGDDIGIGCHLSYYCCYHHHHYYYYCCCCCCCCCWMLVSCR
jgi:hypothetical protein